tara:strand:+ start:236 stop:1453 length:1218 start_codon:yes stop_codon:yes gene_type:complete
MIYNEDRSQRIFDVTAFGAEGDGVADDTAAFQRTFDALAQAGSGRLFIPTGIFRITKTVNCERCTGLFSVTGDGPGSVLLWEVDETLLEFDSKNPLGMVTIADFTVASVGAIKSAMSTAFAFPAGLVKSQIENVQLIGAGGLPVGNVSSTVPIGSGFDLGNVTDTVAIRNCLLWFGSGTGVKIGRGSEVRIIGGRFIGTKNDGGPKSSIGLHVTGNNGGVHVTTTDVISWGTGLQLDQSNGQGSNREIFLSHATLDSNQRGLAVFDSSYVSVAGIWAASSDFDNIWTHPDSNPQLTIAGGTIFNAGAVGGDCEHDQCNGITVNAGTFVMSGVEVRNNKGNGIWTPSNRTTGYVISGCRVVDNGAGARLSGENFVVTGNVFSDNTVVNIELYQPSSAHVVANNVGV